MEDKLKEIRKEIFLTAYSASIAHIASAFSIVEILYTLYKCNILNYDPKNPNSEGRDYFILSKGHGSLALYQVLADVGFFDKSILKTFSKPGSILGGEPCYPYVPGVETSTGSLGHGLSYATGVAKALKLDGKKSKVYCLLGDGECEEGTVWEATMFAVHERLDNLTIIVDCNKIQKMGSLEDVMGIKSYKEYFQAFGCDVCEVNGHDVEELEKCFKQVNNSLKPRVVLANTVKGKGVSIVENNPRWHWKLPNKRELKVFVNELNISDEEIEECKKLI